MKHKMYLGELSGFMESSGLTLTAFKRLKIKGIMATFEFEDRFSMRHIMDQYKDRIDFNKKFLHFKWGTGWT